jgi:hypothetical protein
MERSPASRPAWSLCPWTTHAPRPQRHQRHANTQHCHQKPRHRQRQLDVIAGVAYVEDERCDAHD